MSKQPQKLLNSKRLLILTTDEKLLQRLVVFFKDLTGKTPWHGHSLESALTILKKNIVTIDMIITDISLTLTEKEYRTYVSLCQEADSLRASKKITTEQRRHLGNLEYRINMLRRIILNQLYQNSEKIPLLIMRESIFDKQDTIEETLTPKITDKKIQIVIKPIGEDIRDECQSLLN